MKKTVSIFNRYISLSFFISIFLSLSPPLFSQPPATYVNPFIGTGGHGHTFPGASMPFGMVQLSPDTRLEGWDGCSAYHFLDSIVYGFSHTHLSGTGCSDYGDILLMPTTGELQWSNREYSSIFGHHDEKAEPGYYATQLDKYGIGVELTVTKRVGFHKYQYPEGKTANVMIDLIHRDQVLEAAIEIVGDREIRGFRRSRAWAEDQYVYFAARFSRPFREFRIKDGDKISGSKKEKGTSIQCLISFEPSAEPLLVKVGISAVSTSGAAANIDAELPGWDFEGTRRNALEAWNRELGKINVSGDSEQDKQTFYTALYHCMLSPNLYMDADGSYRGRDNKIHKAVDFDYYSVFSLWDTYRALHPLLTIIDQKRTTDFIKTFIAQYEQGGLLPVWELSANETFCMIGYHAVPVIVDAYVKNIRGFDEEKAFEACKNSAMQDKSGLDLYRKYGYIPGDLEHESVSKTLEYAYDDWCISQMALILGKTKDFEEFNRRAQYYKNIFDPSTKFMRPKHNACWLSPFQPAEVNNNYTEANAWQYTFYVPHDLTNLIKLMGGKPRFVEKLDLLFSTNEELSGRPQADITGLIGQYAHGNEPSHHMAYLYNSAGQAWKTQELTRRIMSEMYFPEPGGLIGNEDCGQMSAWYVFTAMGLYPVCPGQRNYAITTPGFKEIKINLENGKTFTVKASTLTVSNKYIFQAYLNDQYYSRAYLNHMQIMDGGTLDFTLNSMPNQTWGYQDLEQFRTEVRAPLIVPNPFIVAASRQFTDSLEIGLACPEKADIYYTLDGTEPDNTKLKYDSAFHIRDNLTIKAIAYKGNERSFAVSGSFRKIPAGRTVKLNTSYENQYSANGPLGLIDGIRGTVNWRLGNWQGYQDDDLDAVIDLGKTSEINKITAGFLQDTRSWIFFPNEVEFFSSADGTNFTSLGKVTVKAPLADEKASIKEVSISPAMKTRFVRVVAANFGPLPAWHLSAGEKAHLFVDEIVIE